ERDRFALACGSLPPRRFQDAPSGRQEAARATSLLVDRQVVGRHREEEQGDGGLVARAVGGLAAAVVPLAARPLPRQEGALHPLVVLLPHLPADLVEGVAGVVVAVPVVLAVVADPGHELDGGLDLLR